MRVTGILSGIGGEDRYGVSADAVAGGGAKPITLSHAWAWSGQCVTAESVGRRP